MLRKEEYRILNIKHMFERSTKRYSERAAFQVKSHQSAADFPITYNEAYNDVCGLGTSLIARGVKDKRIAIVGGNSYEWAVTFLAAICGTGVAVPLDKEFSINELKHFLNVTQCRCAVFSGELEDVFRQIANDGVTGLEMFINMDKEKGEWDVLSLRELIVEGREMVTAGNQDFLNAQIVCDELCSIILTAGTTNVQKGVNLSHANIAAEIEMVYSTLNISENDVFFSRLPLHCALECICGILLPLSRGAAISYYAELKHSIEISSLPGYSLTESASLAALSLSESASLAAPDLFQNASLAPLNPNNGSVGRPLPGMKAKITHPDPETGIGEICLAGENIMMGYCNDPAATVEVLKGGWLYTGDLGWIDGKGHIHIVGRKENVIITEDGKNVYPEELENLLSHIPYILETMVWGKTTDNGEPPVITATVLVDEEKVADILGLGYSKREGSGYSEREEPGYSAAELEKLIWCEIDKINDMLPCFKRINRMVLRKQTFQKNSSQKIIRWYPANRES